MVERAKRVKSRRNRSRVLLDRVRCPSCWESFGPEEVLHISNEILGDDLLGEDERKRFFAKHFDVAGEAHDDNRDPTSLIACPHCRFRLISSMLDTPAQFLSIVGAPASGKTYALTTMMEKACGELGRMLVSMADADPIYNKIIRDNRRILFYNRDSDESVDLLKTSQNHEGLYRRVMIRGTERNCPIPMQYKLSFMRGHEFVGRSGAGRIVVLYDNAGEDFGQTDAQLQGAHAIQHVVHSDAIFVLFDLSQENHWVSAFGAQDAFDAASQRIQAAGLGQSQENTLGTAMERIRNTLRLDITELIDQPIYVVIPKFDLWEERLKISIDEEPIVTDDQGRISLDVDRIESISKQLRDILMTHRSPIVSMAESSSDHVRYIPMSALGYAPRHQLGEDGVFRTEVTPSRVDPRWAAVPLLMSLADQYNNLIPTISTKDSS